MPQTSSTLVFGICQFFICATLFLVALHSTVCLVFVDEISTVYGLQQKQIPTMDWTRRQAHRQDMRSVGAGIEKTCAPMVRPQSLFTGCLRGATCLVLTRFSVWKFDSASLLYTCLVCPGFRKHDERHISSHEASTAHKRCLKAHDQAIIQSPENTAGPSKIPLSETPGNTFNISDDGKLGRLGRVMRQMDLQDFSESPVFPSRTGSREQSPAFLDWDDPQLHNTGPQISDGTTDLDEERLYGLVYNKIGVDNVLPGSSDGSADGELDDFDSEGEGPSLAREAVLDEMAGPSQPEDSSSANKSKWFPWPSRLVSVFPYQSHWGADNVQTYIYDVLRNVPRCAFSRKQIGAVRWAMSAAGLAETPPSDSKMDSVDRDLQEKCGIRSLRYEGKLGHVYYVNDLAGIVAQVGFLVFLGFNYQKLTEDT